MEGTPVAATAPAMASTAGVSRRIWLSEPPRPVTMMIMADVRRAFSTQSLVRAARWFARVFR